jgi:hypothetical protein
MDVREARGVRRHGRAPLEPPRLLAPSVIERCVLVGEKQATGAVQRTLRSNLRGYPVQPTVLLFGNRRGGARCYRVFRRDSWDPAVRATCASLLVGAGASVKDVQAHLGHKDITTALNLYARVRPGRSADLAARMDQLIAEGTHSRSAHDRSFPCRRVGYRRDAPDGQ